MVSEDTNNLNDVIKDTAVFVAARVEKKVEDTVSSALDKFSIDNIQKLKTENEYLLKLFDGIVKEKILGVPFGAIIISRVVNKLEGSTTDADKEK